MYIWQYVRWRSKREVLVQLQYLQSVLPCSANRVLRGRNPSAVVHRWLEDLGTQSTNSENSLRGQDTQPLIEGSRSLFPANSVVKQYRTGSVAWLQACKDLDFVM
jgi:hypothetical protein